MKSNFDACYLIIWFWDFRLDFTERVTNNLMNPKLWIDLQIAGIGLQKRNGPVLPRQLNPNACLNWPELKHVEENKRFSYDVVNSIFLIWLKLSNQSIKRRVDLCLLQKNNIIRLIWWKPSERTRLTWYCIYHYSNQNLLYRRCIRLITCIKR